MKRFLGHLSVAGLVVGTGAVLLPACAHDDSSIFVRQVLAPPAFSPTLGCVYPTPSNTSTSLFTGHFDVGLSSAYSPVVLIANQLTARGDSLTVRTETARVELRGVIVRITDAVGADLAPGIGTFTSLTDGFLEPAQGSAPGLGQAAVTLIDPPTSKLLRETLKTRSATKTVVVYFKVFGQTLGGTYVESGETQFVVETCNGCLVSFPSDSVVVTPSNTVNCNAPVPVGSAAMGVLTPCNQGHETPTDCRLCKGLPACNPAIP